MHHLVAPQAPLEESATTEASRRCPLTGMLAGFRGRFGDRFLRHLRLVYAFWLSQTSPRSSSGSARSVCLFLCFSVSLFVHTFFRLIFGPILNGIQSQIHEKSAPKTGPRAAHAAERDPISDWPPCRGRCTLLKWRLRRHLPIQPNWWRRSCQRTPVAPPAPAGSILVRC